MQWTLDLEPVEPVEAPRFDPSYPEVVVHGLAAMLPALEKYFSKLPRPTVDGGYYTKTRPNRPLIGPLPVQGAFMIGALSGFGVMSSCGAGELLACTWPPRAAFIRPGISFGTIPGPGLSQVVGELG